MEKSCCAYRKSYYYKILYVHNTIKYSEAIYRSNGSHLFRAIPIFQRVQLRTYWITHNVHDLNNYVFSFCFFVFLTILFYVLRVFKYECRTRCMNLKNINKKHLNVFFNSEINFLMYIYTNSIVSMPLT